MTPSMLEPEWVLEQSLSLMRRRLQDAQIELEERLVRAREREKALRDAEKRHKAKKRVSDVFTLFKLLPVHIISKETGIK